MTSKLKVNLINDSGDNNIITSDGSGVITSSKFKIGQVIDTVVGTTDIANTDSFIGSGATITPTSTSSKVLIMVDGYVEQTTGSAGNYAELILKEGDTSITTLNNAITYQYTVGARIPFSINFRRSPGTTSAVQYRLYHNEISGGATYRYYQQTFTLMEILP